MSILHTSILELLVREGVEHANRCRQHLQAHQEILQVRPVLRIVNDTRANQDGDKDPLHIAAHNTEYEHRACSRASGVCPWYHTPLSSRLGGLLVVIFALEQQLRLRHS